MNDRLRGTATTLNLIVWLGAMALMLTANPARQAVATEMASGAGNNPVIIDLSAAEARTAASAGPAATLMARTRQQGRLRVIVGLRERPAGASELAAPAAEGLRSRLRTKQEALLTGLGVRRQADGTLAGNGMQHVVLFDTVPFLAATVDPTALQGLLAAGDVVSIQEDVPVPPTLAQSVPLIRADQAAAQNVTGTNQVVAILDTGVVKTHPMLKGKVVAEACYSTTSSISTSLCPRKASSSTAPGSGVNCSPGIQGCDHGTHVASIAAGNTTSLKGVARDARIIAIQIFSRFNNARTCSPAPAPCILSYTSDQIRGLERVLALRGQYNIAAVNMSLGGGLYSSACDASNPAQKAVIDNLRSVGIATVIAAGNNGADGFISAPACISTAVAVGSTTKADQISSFSNHAALVDLMAPGSSIYAAVPSSGYGTKSGTSMATPHVTGAWAVLKQARPMATTSEIESALACTGVPVTRSGVTKPRIDVLGALDILRGNRPGC